MINIIDRGFAKNRRLFRSERKGEELVALAFSSYERGITSEEYFKGRQIIVSLTTHGKRIYEVFKSIESIMQGSMLPNRIVLWLSVDFFDKPLPKSLINQKKRGLEIYYVNDLGPHTKLIPALRKFPEDIIVTIDDDMYYQYDMLENLINAYLVDPTSIHANRVTIMTFNNNSNLNSYLKWIHYCHPDKNTSRNLITGVEGCLYPPHSLHEEVFNESIFRDICRYADDVWFTAMALLKGTPIKHVYTHYPNGCAGGIENKNVQDIGLYHRNDSYGNCRNDVQIKAVFDYYNIYSLIREA